METDSFKAYVHGRKRVDTPAGDFIAGAKGDRTFPDARSWRQLEWYLVMRGTIPDAMKAAKAVWRSFQALQRRSVLARIIHDGSTSSSPAYQ